MKAGKIISYSIATAVLIFAAAIAFSILRSSVGIPSLRWFWDIWDWLLDMHWGWLALAIAVSALLIRNNFTKKG